jgi:hypothetical protein
MLEKLCSTCNICLHIPDERRGPRYLKLEANWRGEEPLILVIDEYPLFNPEEEFIGISMLLDGMSFTYTSAVRCNAGEDLSEENGMYSINACSVWTRQLLNDRKVIITTEFGLIQMGIKDKRVGDMFKTTKYGIVLVTPSIQDLLKPEFKSVYQPKIQRVLREAGLL